jgi:peptide/nickel transport system permease protein
MLLYILRRLVSLLPSLFIMSVLVFSFVHLIPGDPAIILLGDQASPAQVAELKTSLGLDQPIYVQYLKWAGAALQGDFGKSVFFSQPVAEVIAERTETSVWVASLSFILVLLIGIPTGIISAVKYNSKLDQFFSGASMFLASIPTFWLGLNLMTLFAVQFKWLPSSGFPSILQSGDLTNLRYLILPCLTLAAPNSALITRLTRASMLDVFKEDYVRTARAKGLHELKVVMAHVFRNSLIAVVSALGFTFVGLVAGTVVTETVFSLPGVGRLVVESVLRRDYPVIQAIILFIDLLYMLINLLVDISYAWLDPRIRHG